MRARRVGSTSLAKALRLGGAVLVLVALVATVGSAQAGTSTKKYTASIDPTTVAAGSASAQFTLTLTNSSGSTQTLGSANFTAPSGWPVSSPAAGSSASVTSDEGKNWTVSNASNVVQFRAVTSGDALTPGHSVSAVVTTSVSCATGTVTWTTEAKQSNGFNGPPGNDFVNVGSDPTVTVTAGGAGGTLGSFVFDPIGRQAINSPFTVTVTAKDTCGYTKTDYTGGATLSGTLGGSPTYGSFGTWSSGSASASVTATVSEAARTLTATDGSATGTSNAFDIFDAICSSSTLCTATNSTTHVETLVDSNQLATMALRLSAPGAQFSCNGSQVSVGSLVTLVPSDYTGQYFATLTYDKSVAPGTGVANFIVCLSKTAGSWAQLKTCNKSPSAPCIYSRNRTGVGDLVIVLLLDQSDPVGGTYN